MSIRSFLSKRRREAVLDFYNLLLAAFLFVTPWLFAYPNAGTRLDMWITSAVIVAIACLAIVAYASWEEWVNMLLGAWLIVSPWAVGFVHARAMHYSIAIGVLIVFLSAIELFLAYDQPQGSPPSHGAA